MRKLHLPYTIALAAIGLVLGVLGNKEELKAYEAASVRAMPVQSVLDEIDNLRQN